MRLTDTIRCGYKTVDEKTIEIKSALISMCSDIVRYFKLKFNTDLTSDIDEEKFSEVKKFFPKLNGLTCEQFNKLTYIFQRIRNENAHLYSNRDVYVKSELQKALLNISKQKVLAFYEERLTIFGQIYIASFLALKSQIWPVVTTIFKSNYFKDVPHRNISEYQIEMQTYLNSYCGYDKPIFPVSKYKIDKTALAFLNDCNKKNLTRIFFDIEEALTPSKTCAGEVLSIWKIMRSSSKFPCSDYTIKDLTELRNVWFHGSWIFDDIIFARENTHFDFELIVSILLSLKTDLQNKKGFEKIVNDIEAYAKAMFDNYLLKLVEVSYKLLDKNLFNKDKVSSRCLHSQQAFTRFENMNLGFFALFERLLPDAELKWLVHHSKVDDHQERCFECKNFEILRIECKNGIEIAGIKTEHKFVYLVDAKIDEDQQNKINGMKLSEIKFGRRKFYNKRICLKKATI